MKMLTPRKLWDEIIFGDGQLERRIYAAFPDQAEFLSAPSNYVTARRVLRVIIRTHYKNVLTGAMRTKPTSVPLINNFALWLENELTSIVNMSTLPESILEDLEEEIYEHLAEPDELPVEWSVE